MKKFLCALLASLTVLSFAGCGIEVIAPPADTDEPAVVTPADDETEEPVVEDEVEEPVEEPVEEVNAFSPGVVDGNVYTHESTGITFTAPDGWTFMNDAELAEMMELDPSLVADSEEYAKTLSELDTVYGMVAQSSDQLNNIQVMYENTAVTGNKMNGEAYVKLLSAQLESVYAEVGATAEIGEIETVKIGDNEFYFVDIAVDMGGIILEQGYACKKFDDCIASIIITAYEKGAARTLLECFA